MADDLANTRRTPSLSKPARSTIRLQDRDVALLAWLFPHGLAEREQVEEAFFTSTARCNSRLLQLLKAGLIARCPLQDQRSNQAVYRLTAAAYPIVARRLGLDVPTVRRIHRSRTNQHVAHGLCIVDLYVAILRAVRNAPELRLDLWLVEWQIRHEYRRLNNGKSQLSIFRPDAFARLQLPDRSYHSFFAEIDRAHVSGKKWQQTVTSHLSYARSGLFPQVYGTDTSFLSLAVTGGGQRRLDHLRDIARDCGAEMFRFTTEQRLRDGGFLGRIWQTVQDNQPVALLPQLANATLEAK